MLRLKKCFFCNSFPPMKNTNHVLEVRLFLISTAMLYLFVVSVSAQTCEYNSSTNNQGQPNCYMCDYMGICKPNNKCLCLEEFGGYPHDGCCWPYSCNFTSTDCFFSCVNDTQCQPPNTCGNNGVCSISSPFSSSSALPLSRQSSSGMQSSSSSNVLVSSSTSMNFNVSSQIGDFEFSTTSFFLWVFCFPLLFIFVFVLWNGQKFHFDEKERYCPFFSAIENKCWKRVNRWKIDGFLFVRCDFVCLPFTTG